MLDCNRGLLVRDMELRKHYRLCFMQEVGVSQLFHACFTYATNPKNRFKNTLSSKGENQLFEPSLGRAHFSRIFGASDGDHLVELRHL